MARHHKFVLLAAAAGAVLAAALGLGQEPEAKPFEAVPVPDLSFTTQNTASQSPSDAERDEVYPVVANLPLPQRIGSVIAEARSTPEGIWVLSRPSFPEQLQTEDGCLRQTPRRTPRYLICDREEYSELLLLSPDRTRILRAFPQPGGGRFGRTGGADWFQVTEQAVYCGHDGVGKLSDSTVCRVDRSTFEFEGIVLTCEITNPTHVDGCRQEVTSIAMSLLAGNWIEGLAAGAAGIEIEDDGEVVLVSQQRRTRTTLRSEPFFSVVTVVRP
jgi:hypothetical protein